MTIARHLVIFARAPRLGQVKRRLAHDLGMVAAWRFHRLNAGNLIRRLGGDPQWVTWLAMTPEASLRHPKGLWPHSGPLIGQGPGNLGARMGRVFRQMPPGPVVIVGSDIPGIRRSHVAAAFECLGRHEFVLGPATDGGYWLIGARRRPALRLTFKGVRWGGPEALADTLGNLGIADVALLEKLQDVDHASDLAVLDSRLWVRVVNPPRSYAP